VATTQPWLHPDLTNAVCSSMSIGDVKVLANRQALEAQRANQEVRVTRPPLRSVGRCIETSLHTGTLLLFSCQYKGRPRGRSTVRC
jgi:hypothetical protein